MNITINPNDTVVNRISDGGPAFPLQSIGPDFMPGHCGMSLRDWFAGQALAGLCTLESDCSCDGYAHDAYLYADAMLKARKQ